MADVCVSRTDDHSGASSRDKTSKGQRWPSAAHGPTLSGGAPQTLDGRGDVVPIYSGWRQPFMYWDWFFRPWAYLDTPVHFVAWYSCAGFYFGAIFFIIGSFASIAPAVCCLLPACCWTHCCHCSSATKLNLLCSGPGVQQRRGGELHA